MTSRCSEICFLVANFLIVTCLLSGAVFAQGFCAAGSSIDGVPFFIGQSYSDILDRAPDRGGQLYHIETLESLNTSNCQSVNPAESAGSCEWNDNAATTMDFLGSPESIAKNGTLADNTAFVTALYELLLRRAPDTTGLDWYLSLLNSGTQRVSVVFDFLSSTEYRKRFTCTYGAVDTICNGAESVDPMPSFVTQTYQDILDRSPDGEGWDWWTNYMATNQLNMCANTSGSDFSVCDRVFESQTTLSFFESPEYQRSNPSIEENAAFVTALYEHLLRRAPDQGGLQYYTNYLNLTNDRLGTIYQFLMSTEYRKRFACYAGSADKLNFGLNGHPFSGQAYFNSGGVDFATQISLVQNANLTWYRVTTPAPGSGGNYSQMDLLLNKAQAAGIQLLPVLIPVVDRNTDTLAQLYSESYSGAFNIVQRYKASIHVWEISNEEDVYSILGPAYNGDTINEYDPARLAISEAILHGLADGARAADSGCVRIVNFGWIHTGFIELLENDAIPYDVLGIHWYANAATTGQPAMGDVTCPGQNLPCPVQPRYFNLVDRLQTLTSGKPLWVTENNYWPVLPSNSVATNVAWEEGYLPPTLQFNLNWPSVYPYQMVMIYELLDEPYLQGGAFFTQMGLYEVNQSSNGDITLGAPKPAYQSVQQLLSGR
jgi:uncharacterized protein DUF4214